MCMNVHFVIQAVYAELNMYLYISTLFTLIVVENEQVGAKQDGPARLARQNSQARTRTGKPSCFPDQLTTSRIAWQPYPVDSYSAEGVDHSHIQYMHMYILRMHS